VRENEQPPLDIDVLTATAAQRETALGHARVLIVFEGEDGIFPDLNRL
jgi:hypothetical protein